MQAVLCVVLAGSLALAEWVVHDRTVNGVTRLAAIEFFGPIGVRLPQGWLLKKQSVHASIRVMVEEPAADETSGETPGRMLNLIAEKVPTGMSAESYLAAGNVIATDPEPINIGPIKGILVARPVTDIQSFFSPGPIQTEWQLIACGVDPNGMAIKIVLQWPLSANDDVEGQKQFLRESTLLMRDVARGIVVQSDGGKR